MHHGPHGLSGLSIYELNGQRTGDEHPTYAPDGVPVQSKIPQFKQHDVPQQTQNESLHLVLVF